MVFLCTPLRLHVVSISRPSGYVQEALHNGAPEYHKVSQEEINTKREKYVSCPPRMCLFPCVSFLLRIRHVHVASSLKCMPFLQEC